MKRFLGFFFILAAAGIASAQTLPKVYNQFFMNPYLYNAAYAGVEGHSVVFLTYKKDWLGITGAPALSSATFHVPLKGGLAIGAMAYNETLGPYTQSAGKVSAGYLISIDKEHFFRFGMSLGAGSNSLRFGELDAPGDPAFQGLVDNPFFLLGDFGATYHFGHFNVGLSVPNLVTYDFFTQEGLVVRIKPHEHLMFKANYRGHINDNIAVEPHLIYRYNKYLKGQYEATMIFHLLHQVWVGGTYRQDAGFIGLLGTKLLGRMAVGYAYSYGNGETASLLGPSHEIHIGYHLSDRKHHAHHKSSFIDSHRKELEQRAKEAELERQRKLQELQKSRQLAQQTQSSGDELTLVTPVKKEEPKGTPWAYEKESEPIERKNEFGEIERGIRFDRINELGQKEVVFSWLPPPPEGAAEEIYEIVPDSQPLIRTSPSGKKEAGIKWTRTVDGGQKETLIIWSEILTEAEANQLDHNEAVAASFGDAKITIRREDPVAPQKEEPKKEPEPVVVKEEPKPVVKEEPKKEEPKPVVKEEPKKEEPKPVVKEEPKKEEPKPVVIQEPKKEEPKPVVKEEPVVRPPVSTGGHMLQLAPGHYVIAGAFRDFSNAERVSDRLFERGFRENRVGYQAKTGLYYVLVFESTDANRARKERDRLKNVNGLEQVWVLTVTE